MQAASCIYYSAVPSLRCINITPVFWISSICFSVQKALLEVGFVGYFVYAPCGGERLEPVASTVNHCVLCILIATPDRLK